MLPLARALFLLALATSLTPAPALAAEPTPAPIATPPNGTWLFIPRGNRLVATSLSLAWNGTGQLYNGENEKGLGMMAGWIAYPVAYGIDTLVGTAYVRLFAFAANMGIKAWSAADAYDHAAPYPTPVPASPSPAPKP